MEPQPIAADLKDWTWVIDRPCPECGYVAAEIDPTELGALIRDNAATWRDALAGSDVSRRPNPTTWSALEYGCHVRDVHRTVLVHHLHDIARPRPEGTLG